MVYVILDNEEHILSVWYTLEGAEEAESAYSCDTHIEGWPVDVII